METPKNDQTPQEQNIVEATQFNDLEETHTKRLLNRAQEYLDKVDQSVNDIFRFAVKYIGTKTLTVLFLIALCFKSKRDWIWNNSKYIIDSVWNFLSGIHPGALAFLCSFSLVYVVKLIQETSEAQDIDRDKHPEGVIQYNGKKIHELFKKIKWKRVCFVSRGVAFTASGFILILIQSNNPWVPAYISGYIFFIALAIWLEMNKVMSDSTKLVWHLIISSFIIVYTVKTFEDILTSQDGEVDYSVSIPYTDSALSSNIGSGGRQVIDMRLVFIKKVKAKTLEDARDRALDSFWQDSTSKSFEIYLDYLRHDKPVPSEVAKKQKQIDKDNIKVFANDMVIQRLGTHKNEKKE